MKEHTHTRVPDWAADAIWYQIFPERFRNGCPVSNPRLADITTQKIAGWRPLPWGQEWYAQDAWEQKRGEFFNSVFYRRYGGDLVGLRYQLKYLQQLGVTALYLNPVFMSCSLHKYDATCYHHIDPTLGPDRDGDMRRLAQARETEDPATWIWTAADLFFLDLVQEVHRRGMKIILDGVFNHTGTRFFAFADLVKHGKSSRYQDWYRIKEWKPDGSFDYEGWFGHKALPELSRDAHTLAEPVRKHIFDVTRRWMQPDGPGKRSRGIDGWRLDVAFCIPHGFWKEWYAFVKELNPAAYTTGEIVGPAEPWLQGDEFDAVMNYMWLYPVLSFFTPSAQAISVREFQRRMQELWRRYDPAHSYAMQNLLDSHDTGRILTMLENACPPFKDWDSYFNYPRAGSNPDLKTACPGASAVAALQAMVVFQMTDIGAPMIYYGTEVGMWGGNDPCNRQPMFWRDIPLQDETRGLRGRLPRKHPRKPHAGLLRFYKQAIALRRAHPELRRGRRVWVKTDQPRLLAYRRVLGANQVFVAINAGDAPATCQAPFAGQDLWTGQPCGAGPQTLPPRGWLVLKKM